MPFSLVIKPLFYSLLVSIFVFASLLLIQKFIFASELEEVAQSSSVVILAGEKEEFSTGKLSQSWKVSEWMRKKNDLVSPEDFIESEDALGNALYLNSDGTVIPAR